VTGTKPSAIKLPMDFLRDITWKQFLSFLTIAFVIYYTAAILLLIKQWLQNAKTSPGKKTIWLPETEEIKQVIADPLPQLLNDDIPTMEPVSPEVPPEEDTQIIRFGNGLEQIIGECRTQPDRQVILFKLSHLLPAFTQLNNDLLRMPLTAVMQKRLMEELNIELSTTEIENIWNNSLEQNTGSVVG
jgi:hypothetical protein